MKKYQKYVNLNQTYSQEGLGLVLIPVASAALYGLYKVSKKVIESAKNNAKSKEEQSELMSVEDKVNQLLNDIDQFKDENFNVGQRLTITDNLSRFLTFNGKKVEKLSELLKRIQESNKSLSKFNKDATQILDKFLSEAKEYGLSDETDFEPKWIKLLDRNGKLSTGPIVGGYSWTIEQNTEGAPVVGVHDDKNVSGPTELLVDVDINKVIAEFNTMFEELGKLRQLGISAWNKGEETEEVVLKGNPKRELDDLVGELHGLGHNWYDIDVGTDELLPTSLEFLKQVLSSSKTSGDTESSTESSHVLSDSFEADEVKLQQVSDDIDVASGILDEVGKVRDSGISQEGICFANIALNSIFKRYNIKQHHSSLEGFENSRHFYRSTVTTTSFEGVGESLAKVFTYLASLFKKTISKIVDYFTTSKGAFKKLSKRVEKLKEIKAFDTEGTIKTTKYTNVFADSKGNVLTKSSDIEKSISRGFDNIRLLTKFSEISKEVEVLLNNAKPFANYMNGGFKQNVSKYFPNDLTKKDLLDEGVDENLSGETDDILGGARCYIANIMGDNNASAKLKYGIIKPEIDKLHEEHEFEKLKDPKGIIDQFDSVLDSINLIYTNVERFKKSMDLSTSNLDKVVAYYRRGGKFDDLPDNVKGWISSNFPETNEDEQRTYLSAYKTFLLWVKDICVHPWVDIIRHETIMLSKVTDYLQEHAKVETVDTEE